MSGKRDTGSQSEMPTGPALPGAPPHHAPRARVQCRRRGRLRACVVSPPAPLAARSLGLVFPVTLAGEAGGRATHLKPRLPENVAQRQLIGDGLQGLGVAVGRLLHHCEDLAEPGLGRRRQWAPLPGVLGNIEEQRRVMAADEVPVAEAHVRGEAAVGALGAELGREEERLPDGRACGSQGHRLVGWGHGRGGSDSTPSAPQDRRPRAHTRRAGHARSGAARKQCSSSAPRHTCGCPCVALWCSQSAPPLHVSLCLSLSPSSSFSPTPRSLRDAVQTRGRGACLFCAQDRRCGLEGHSGHPDSVLGPTHSGLPALLPPAL